MTSSRRHFANVAAAILILTVVFIVGAAPTPARGNLAPMVCISLADYSPITFPSGCSSTSVLNGICVNLNGPTATVQTASFSNLLPSGSDFTIRSNSTSVTLPRGMIANFNISLTGDTGFFGTISLTVRSSSYAISGWFSAPIVNLQINGTALSILNILSLAAIPPGSYNATIIATAGHISHTLTVSMNILAQEAVNAIQNEDFSNGIRALSDTFVPVPIVNSTGECTGNLPEMKVYDISGLAGQTVDVRFSAEAYTCCRADSLFTDVMVVPKGSAGLRDFSIAAGPGSLTVPRTTNGTFTVTLSSLNGFDSSVELNATVAPSSPMWPHQIPTVVFN